MRLSDCFVDLIAYVVYFRRSAAARQPAFEQVKADVARLLAQSESAVRRGEVPQDEYEQAKFAVCAWVDEAILASQWAHKGLWQREQLQRVHFGTTDAGEEFFERLNGLGFQQQEVREVYYLCLALGFMGRYCHPGDEFLLEQLKTSNLKLLLGTSAGIPSLERAELFPEAYPAQSAAPAPQAKKPALSPLAVAAVAGPVALFVILWVIYRFSLGGIGENFLRTVPY